MTYEIIEKCHSSWIYILFTVLQIRKNIFLTVSCKLSDINYSYGSGFFQAKNWKYLKHFQYLLSWIKSGLSFLWCDVKHKRNIYDIRTSKGKITFYSLLKNLKRNKVHRRMWRISQFYTFRIFFRWSSRYLKILICQIIRLR